MKPKRVLVAPLDWGLGHASRCVPVIRALQQLGCSVFLAGAGPSLKLLQTEFPKLPAFHLPPYNPVYPHKGSMMVKMLLQVGRFNRVVRAEHRATVELVGQQGIDAIIADNRYGCYVDGKPCVLITHQLNLQAPIPWQGLALLANSVTRRYLRKFTGCWVPDFPGSMLTGKLSATTDKQIRFIGPLSRFGFPPEQTQTQYDVLALISGPEPQRSLFETLVSQQLVQSGKKALIVRGVIHQNRNWLSENVEVVDYLSGATLEQALLQSEIVLARSGYSTIMDLARLQKKAIFVPTPGQTEQEYLASRFEKSGITFFMNQKSFSLTEALRASEQYCGFKKYTFDNELLLQPLKEFLSV